MTDDTSADGYLVELVKLVNGENSELYRFPVTLDVNGSVITGMLCSIDKYFESTQALLEEHYKEKLSRSNKNNEIEIPDDAHKVLAESLIPRTDNTTTPRFIHLIGVARYLPGMPFKLFPDKQFWRGEIASVDGYTIGIVSTEAVP